MSEGSTEAIAAGEAAAAAVEAVQSREELNETVAATGAVAVEAVQEAAEARTDAEIAVQVASEAAQASAGVADRVDEAQYTANAATEIASTAVAEAQEAQEIALTVDQKLDRLLDILTAQNQPQQASTDVQEVEVSQNGDNSAQASAAATENGNAESGPARSRRRAGRFNRRNSG